MAACGCICSHMVDIWVHMVAYARVWPHMASYGCIWLRMAAYGFQWPRVGAHGQAQLLGQEQGVMSLMGVAPHAVPAAGPTWAKRLGSMVLRMCGSRGCSSSSGRSSSSNTLSVPFIQTVPSHEAQGKFTFSTSLLSNVCGAQAYFVINTVSFIQNPACQFTVPQPARWFGVTFWIGGVTFWICIFWDTCVDGSAVLVLWGATG